MAEKTLGFTKPKVKAQRIQLSFSLAQANKNLLQSQKPSFGDSYPTNILVSKKLNTAKRKIGYYKPLRAETKDNTETWDFKV